jgi:hypothetical protein
LAPTAPRIVYVTLRGLAIAGALRAIKAACPVRLVEVHPGAAFALRGAPLDAVLAFKRDPGARGALIRWLGDSGMAGLEDGGGCGEHFVAACAAARAAHEWSEGRPKWLAAADPPWHPYDFAC